MRECPLMNAAVPLGAPTLPTKLMGQEESVQRLGVGPPQLLFGMFLKRSAPIGVDTQEESAILPVPSPLHMPTDHFDGLGDDIFLASPKGPVQHEPHGFDGMARH